MQVACCFMNCIEKPATTLSHTTPHLIITFCQPSDWSDESCRSWTYCITWWYINARWEWC
jgi:hypothetical protein